MRLTVQTDYALRLLMHLAVREGQLTTIAACAERYQISRNHLMKVAYQLGQRGYIETQRGRSGGLRLAHPASKINVGAIVRQFEAHSPIAPCFPNGAGGCAITSACKLKSALNEAMDAFFNVLDGYTLGDLVSGNSALENLLSGA